MPTGRELLTRIDADGALTLWLAPTPEPDLGPDEVVIRIEATPINPSDIGLLFGPADLSTLRAAGTREEPRLVGVVPEPQLAGVAARIGQALPAGNEGAGVVIAAGRDAQELIGRTVATLSGTMYATERTAPAAACLVLPEGTPPRAGASAFVNPLTALGMVETMRAEGHTALVHTAAASNLGQMLVRVCRDDGIGLVNVVRSEAQRILLRDAGAEHVVDSSTPGFAASLTDAIAATGATLAFDAIGGGRLGSAILGAMETAASRRVDGTFSRYGTPVHKQLYVYGSLDMGATEIVRSFGMAWGIGGWLLPWFLERVGPARAQAMRERVAAELTTTFASTFMAALSLREALDPENVAAYTRRATGAKYLIDPSRE